MPVFVDPSTPTAELDACLDEIRPDGFIGIHRAHLLRVRHRTAFSNLRYAIVGRRFSWLPLPSYRGPLARLRGPATASRANSSVTRPERQASRRASSTPAGWSRRPYPRGPLSSMREEGDRNLSFQPIFSLLDMCLGVTVCFRGWTPQAPRIRSAAARQDHA
jgi:hypothetical protein